jgi:hypothetical protein
MRKPKVYRTSQRPGRSCNRRRLPAHCGSEPSQSTQLQQPARLANAPPEKLSHAEPFVDLKADFNLSLGFKLKVSGIKLRHILVGLVRAICSLFSCIFVRNRPRLIPLSFFFCIAS